MDTYFSYFCPGTRTSPNETDLRIRLFSGRFVSKTRDRFAIILHEPIRAYARACTRCSYGIYISFSSLGFFLAATSIIFFVYIFHNYAKVKDSSNQCTPLMFINLRQFYYLLMLFSNGVFPYYRFRCIPLFYKIY